MNTLRPSGSRERIKQNNELDVARNRIRDLEHQLKNQRYAAQHFRVVCKLLVKVAPNELADLLQSDGTLYEFWLQQQELAKTLGESHFKLVLRHAEVVECEE